MPPVFTSFKKISPREYGIPLLKGLFARGISLKGKGVAGTGARKS
jgi:hypothetical protein